MRKKTPARPKPNVVELFTKPQRAFLSDSLATIDTLKYLLQMAQAGECIGLAFVAMMPNKRFELGLVGEADRSSVFTIGCLTMFQQDLVQQSLQQGRCP